MGKRETATFLRRRRAISTIAVQSSGSGGQSSSLSSS